APQVDVLQLAGPLQVRGEPDVLDVLAIRLDADLAQIPGHRITHLAGGDDAARVRHEVELHAARVPGLGEELPGPPRVIRHRLDRRVVAELHGIDHGADPQAAPAEDVLDDAVDVDGMRDGLADLEVLDRA